MRTAIALLTGLLIAQLAWFVWLSRGNDDGSLSGTETALLTFTAESVQDITITGGDSGEITLHRDGNHWRVSEPPRFPAHTAAIDRLLQQLNGLRAGWPVATTTDAHRRFDVLPTKFQRRVVIRSAADQTHTLYIGTSTGLREAHLRANDDDAVYRAGLTAQELPTDPGHWQDRSVLERDASKLARVRFERLIAENIDGEWTLAGLADEQQTDSEKLQGLVERLGRLRFQRALVASDAPKAAPDLSIRLEPRHGSAIDYDFYRLEGQPLYRLHCSDRPQVFEVSEHQIAPFTGLRPADWLSSDTPAPDGDS